MKLSHHLLSNEIPYRRAGWLLTIGFLSIVYYLACLTLLRGLSPGLVQFTLGGSHFNASANPIQASAAFMVLGLGGMALTLGLYLAVPAEARVSAGITLLGTWAAATVLAGVFPLLQASPQTSAGGVDNLAGLSLLCMIATAAFMIRRLRGDGLSAR